MAKPRVFVSSTFYDLKYVRADIERFVRDMGYDPVLNERGNIPYGSEERLEEYCYKEVELTDILVAIVGGRYGSESSNSNYSITQMEIKTALKQGKQVYIFIEKSVYSEFHTYLNNKDISNIKYRYVDDIKIFKFIEETENLPQNNPISTFEHSNDIITFLKEQWSGLFQRFLQQQSRLTENKTLENINATAKTLNQLVNFLTEERKSSDHAIKEILLSNHPVFIKLKSLTNTPYPIFFRTKSDLEAWLEARRYNQKENDPFSDEDDAFLIFKHETKSTTQYLKIFKGIFDDNDKLIIFTADEWNEDWILNEEYKPIQISEDDLPF